MTIVVTRNVPGRFRGFLASCMLEVAPGVYVAPQMTKAVRDRVWQVLLEWAALVPNDGGVLQLWRDESAPSGLAVRMLGWSRKEIIDHEGLWLTVGDLTAKNDAEELADLARSTEDA